MVVRLNIANFTYHVDDDRLTIVVDGSHRYFRHPPANQRVLTGVDDYNIILPRVIEQAFVNGNFYDIGECDLNLEFPNMTTLAPFPGELTRVGYREV